MLRSPPPAYRAKNRAQGLTATFTADAFQVRALEQARPLLTAREADEDAKIEQALADLFGLVARLEAGERRGRAGVISAQLS